MNVAKGKMLGAMAIFGTVGIFVHYIPLPSAVIAFCRAVLGAAFLLVLMYISGKRPRWASLRQYGWLLVLSGVALGGNWILLFEAYRYTSVASATACYYLAPMFLLLAAPLLGEKLTVKKLVCVAVAFVGMVFVSGAMTEKEPDLTGIILALGAAVLYATVMVLNKKLTYIPAFDKTLVQLLVAAVGICPYMLLTWQPLPPAELSWLWLPVLGIVHTGVAYWLYFGAVRWLNTQTVALFSYLDPVVAIVLSAAVLQQPMNLFGVVGSVLILGSALYGELSSK